MENKVENQVTKKKRYITDQPRAQSDILYSIRKAILKNGQMDFLQVSLSLLQAKMYPQAEQMSALPIWV